MYIPGNVLVHVFVIACVSQLGLGASPIERQALVDFFNATNGGGWLEADNWTSPSVDPCSWVGVGCSAGGGVQKLHLSRNNLSGSLPSSFGQLSQLTWVLLFVALPGVPFRAVPPPKPSPLPPPPFPSPSPCSPLPHPSLWGKTIAWCSHWSCWGARCGVFLRLFYREFPACWTSPTMLWVGSSLQALPHSLLSSKTADVLNTLIARKVQSACRNSVYSCVWRVSTAT
jgi:hypothetical protein